MTDEQKDFYRLSILADMYRNGLITEDEYRRRALMILDS